MNILEKKITSEMQRHLGMLKEYLARTSISKSGLCYYAFILSSSEAGKMMAEWPEHSGNREYPISVSDKDPKSQYLNFRFSPSEGPYLDARKRLATYLIERLTAELKLVGEFNERYEREERERSMPRTTRW